MQIVINIPEELYEAYKGRPPMLGDAGMDMIAQAIANGTPLPKEHGRLIDADLLREQIHNDKRKAFTKHQVWLLASIHNKTVPTIVEADKDCQDCNEWESCECGKKGHENGTSKGYSIGECTHFLEADKEGNK